MACVDFVKEYVTFSERTSWHCELFTHIPNEIMMVVQKHMFSIYKSNDLTVPAIVYTDLHVNIQGVGVARSAEIGKLVWPARLNSIRNSLRGKLSILYNKILNQY